MSVRKRLTLLSVLGTMVTSWVLVSSHTEARADCSPYAYTGSVCITAGDFCPEGYTNLGASQELLIRQYTALFGVISIIYGGDGRVSLGLPAAEGRILIGDGAGPGLRAYDLSEAPGHDLRALTPQNLPPHTHTATLAAKENTTLSLGVIDDDGTELAPTSDGKSFKAKTVRNGAAQPSFIAAEDTTKLVKLSGASTKTTSDTPFSLTATGGGITVISTVQPQLGLLYCVMLDGDWPDRPD